MCSSVFFSLNVIYTVSKNQLPIDVHACLSTIRTSTCFRPLVQCCSLYSGVRCVLFQCRQLWCWRWRNPKIKSKTFKTETCLDIFLLHWSSSSEDTDPVQNQGQLLQTSNLTLIKSFCFWGAEVCLIITAAEGAGGAAGGEGGGWLGECFVSLSVTAIQ